LFVSTVDRLVVSAQEKASGSPYARANGCAHPGIPRDRADYASRGGTAGGTSYGPLLGLGHVRTSCNHAD
jgi:hypothetical protein